MSRISKTSAIGVFDSGVGGLTVAREIMRQSPNEHIVYFGDTARVPYGSKSRDTITRYSRQIIRFLQTQDVKAIVIACNTASAYALDTVSREFEIPIIGVIAPGARTAINTTRNKRVGIIGTEGTVSSNVYTDYIKSIDPEISVTGMACPLFVPLVEEGWTRDEVTYTIARRYLSNLQTTDIDTLILGCTHYPLLRSTIKDIMGEEVTLVNPAYETARELKHLLKSMDLENPEKNPLLDSEGGCVSGEPYRFFVSDTAQKFSAFANSILPYDINNTIKINIEEY